MAEGGVVEGVGGVVRVAGGDAEDALGWAGGPIGRREGQPIVSARV